MTPSASYRTPVRHLNVGPWSYHLCPTSSSMFRSIAERGSPAVNFFRASAAALCAPSMISVSTVRVTDAAAHAADRCDERRLERRDSHEPGGPRTAAFRACRLCGHRKERSLPSESVTGPRFTTRTRSLPPSLLIPARHPVEADGRPTPAW